MLLEHSGGGDEVLLHTNIEEPETIVADVSDTLFHPRQRG